MLLCCPLKAALKRPKKPNFILWFLCKMSCSMNSEFCIEPSFLPIYDSWSLVRPMSSFIWLWIHQWSAVELCKTEGSIHVYIIFLLRKGVNSGLINISPKFSSLIEGTFLFCCRLHFTPSSSLSESQCCCRSSAFTMVGPLPFYFPFLSHLKGGCCCDL